MQPRPPRCVVGGQGRQGLCAFPCSESEGMPHRAAAIAPLRACGALDRVTDAESHHGRPQGPLLQRAGGVGASGVARCPQGNVGAGLVPARVSNPTACRIVGQPSEQLCVRGARSGHGGRIASRAATRAAPAHPVGRAVPGPAGPITTWVPTGRSGCPRKVRSPFTIRDSPFAGPPLAAGRWSHWTVGAGGQGRSQRYERVPTRPHSEGAGVASDCRVADVAADALC